MRLFHAASDQPTPDALHAAADGGFAHQKGQRIGARVLSAVMTTTDIVSNIDQRLIQAKAEIAQLEAAREALGNGRAESINSQRRRARRRTTRRAQAIVPAGKLTALLDGSGGMSTSELAKAANGRSEQILPLLRELEKTDQIRRTGERRGTRWHLVTDEDRVAARAAEIAAQSKRARGKKEATSKS